MTTASNLRFRETQVDERLAAVEQLDGELAAANRTHEEVKAIAEGFCPEPVPTDGMNPEQIMKLIEKTTEEYQRARDDLPMSVEAITKLYTDSEKDFIKADSELTDLGNLFIVSAYIYWNILVPKEISLI